MKGFSRNDRYIAELQTDDEGRGHYVFKAIDDNGEERYIGSAVEQSRFVGRFGTKFVIFDDAAELNAWGRRHGYSIETA